MLDSEKFFDVFVNFKILIVNIFAYYIIIPLCYDLDFKQNWLIHWFKTKRKNNSYLKFRLTDHVNLFLENSITMLAISI